MPEQTGEGEVYLADGNGVIRLEDVVEDALCKLEAKFDSDNFGRVQRAMTLAREYLPKLKFEVYAARYAAFLGHYRVNCKFKQTS